MLAGAAAAYGLSRLQEKEYEASAQVLLSRQNLAESLTGIPNASATLQADRDVQTQAQLARVPEVARRVIERLGLSERTTGDLLRESSVSARTNTDLLDFRVRDRERDLARRLATAYAQAYTTYRRELDTAAVERARREVTQQLRALEESGDRNTPLYADLVRNEQQLRQMRALLTSNAFVVRTADSASQVQPRPKRNIALGILLGLALGLALAFVREALDTRVRSVEEIAGRLGMPLLARIPPPPRRQQKDQQLVMLADPGNPAAEPFRMLRTSLEFVRLGRDVRTIMVSSAVEQEGKSTTIGNLAIALALAGQRVCLVDLDLRRPFLDRFFGLTGEHGLTHVALGHASLDDALATIPLPTLSRRAYSRTGELEHEEHTGRLEVLPAGPPPPDAGEFVNTPVLAEILDELAMRADVVLIDAPPMLHVGDAMTLSAHVDGIFVVTRSNVLRRHMLTELRRLLDAAPVQKLGFVVTAETGDAARHSPGYYGYARRVEEGVA